MKSMIVLLFCLPYLVYSAWNNVNDQLESDVTDNQFSLSDIIKNIFKRSNGNNLRNKVAHGSTAKPSDYPYVVSIHDHETKNFVCAGVIVHPRWILTANLCLGYDNGGRRKRDVYLSTDGQRQSGPIMAEIFSKPRLFPGWGAGLIHLEKAINTAGKYPIKLARPKDVFFDGMSVAVVGWGRTEKSPGSRTLQQVYTSKKPWSACKKIWRHWPDHNLCIGGGNEAICPGDYGGPVVRKGRNPREDVLIGITWTGHPNSCENGKLLLPSICLNIQHESAQLKKILKQYGDRID